MFGFGGRSTYPPCSSCFARCNAGTVVRRLASIQSFRPRRVEGRELSHGGRTRIHCVGELNRPLCHTVVDETREPVAFATETVIMSFATQFPRALHTQAQARGLQSLCSSSSASSGSPYPHDTLTSLAKTLDDTVDSTPRDSGGFVSSRCTCPVQAKDRRRLDANSP